MQRLNERYKIVEEYRIKEKQEERNNKVLDETRNNYEKKKKENNKLRQELQETTNRYKNISKELQRLKDKNKRVVKDNNNFKVSNIDKKQFEDKVDTLEKELLRQKEINKGLKFDLQSKRYRVLDLERKILNSKVEIIKDARYENALLSEKKIIEELNKNKDALK